MYENRDEKILLSMAINIVAEKMSLNELIDTRDGKFKRDVGLVFKTIKEIHATEIKQNGA